MDDEKYLFDRLIYPFKQGFDKKHNRNYYFNLETKKSLWELPSDILEKVKKFKESYKEEK